MPATDLHERIVAGVFTVIQGLGLASSNGGGNPTIYKQTLPEGRVVACPGVFVTFEDVTEEEEYSFENQVITYPVPVTLFDRQPGEDQTWRPGFLGWRKQLFDVFRPMTTLPGCPEVWDIRLQGKVAIPSALLNSTEYMYVVSGLILKVATNEDWTHS